LRLFKRAGYRVIIASNQPGVARGAMSNADLEAIHQRMRQEAIEAEGEVDAVYCCLHNWDEGCECRKPKPGLLYQAQRDFNLDLTRTPFIGDDERDEAAALSAGCPFYRVSDARSLLDITHQLLEEKGVYVCPTTSGF
jgi:D-glycero-D-manno-heptose 1,7-bisphosphate phosphatase